MDSAKRRRTPFSGEDGQYPPDMDKDMIPLCDALNALPGVRTFFCCSGHGRGNEGEFYIAMGCSSVRSLKRVVRAFSRRVRDSFVAARYVIELDHEFWPLRKDEVCVRVGNKRVDHLNARERKKEFDAVIGLLLKGAEREHRL